MRILMMSLLSFFLVTAASAADFTLASTSFKNHDSIPVKYGCNGKNISPELHWANPPANTQSYTLLLSSKFWAQGIVYKWVVYNIPPTVMKFAEGASKDLPERALTATNTFGDDIYRGPCPPDDKLHEYVFTLYALDAMLTLDESNIENVLEKIQPHILKQAEWVGTFKH
jgi:Raf kinase inhibitor-like YbhB/YbcL family protein